MPPGRRPGFGHRRFMDHAGFRRVGDACGFLQLGMHLADNGGNRRLDLVAVHVAPSVGHSTALVVAKVERITSNLVALMQPRWSRNSPEIGDSSRPALGLQRGLTRHKITKQPDRIGAQGAHDGDELDHIDAPLAPFVFGDKRLRNPFKFAVPVANLIPLGNRSRIGR